MPEMSPEYIKAALATLDRPLRPSNLDFWADLADVTGATDKYEATIAVPFSNPDSIADKVTGGCAPSLKLSPAPNKLIFDGS